MHAPELNDLPALRAPRIAQVQSSKSCLPSCDRSPCARSAASSSSGIRSSSTGRVSRLLQVRCDCRMGLRQALARWKPLCTASTPY